MDETPPPKVKWYYGIVTVLISLVMLGPLAFPLLWKSPRFNFFWKLLLTAIVALATIYMLWGTWYVVEAILNEFRKAGLV